METDTTARPPQQHDDAAVTAMTDAILTRVYGLPPQIAANREAVTVQARLVLADVRPQLRDQANDLLRDAYRRMNQLENALRAYAPHHDLLKDDADGN